MKKFVSLALAAVFALSLAGCCSNKCCYRNNKKMTPAEAACAKDLSKRIRDYKESPELVPQTFNAPCAEELYNRIPCVKQQSDIKTLSYTMANAETGTIYNYLFDRSQDVMKITEKKNGKLVSVVIYKSGKALQSADGVKFFTVSDAEMLNSLRFTFDRKMKFNEFAQEVSTPLQKTYSYDSGKPEVVLSPREMTKEGKRCNVVSVHFVTNDYTADLKLRVDAFTKDVISMHIVSVNGLPQKFNNTTTVFSHTEKIGNFVFYTGSDLYAGKKDKPVLFSIANIKVNEPIDKKEFEVATENITIVTPVAPAKKSSAKKVDVKKVVPKDITKKVDVKKVVPKVVVKGIIKKDDSKKSDAKKSK